MKSADVASWLVRFGIDVTIRQVDGNVSYVPENGFYKSDGFAYLFDREGECFLRARYGEETQVADPWDVVKASREWHDFSRDRFGGWADPPTPWAELYAQLSEMEPAE